MLATRKVKTSCHDSRFNVWCAEIRLSTVSKAALDSDQAQNCQPLDNHDPITKLVGPTKAARAAVADEGADKGAAQRLLMQRGTSQIEVMGTQVLTGKSLPPLQRRMLDPPLLSL